MPWLILFFSLLYFMAAWQGSASLTALNTALGTDLPNYGKFALMLGLIWAIGLWGPARKPAMLLLAVILVGIALGSGSGVAAFFTNLSSLTAGAGIVNTAPSQVQSGVSGSGTAAGSGTVSGLGGGLVGGAGNTVAGSTATALSGGDLISGVGSDVIGGAVSDVFGSIGF